MSTTLVAIQAALADQLADELSPLDASYGELQVAPRRIFNPTPPTLDIYPADTAQEQAGFGYATRDALLVVRARVTMADEDGGQDLLLELSDTGVGSVMGAILGDPTLGGAIDNSAIESQSGFRIYEDVPGSGAYLGVEWIVRAVR